MCRLKSYEEKILDAIANAESIKAGAEKFGVKPKTFYNYLYRVRKRYFEARRFVNKILSYRRKSRILDRAFTRITLERELELEELILGMESEGERA